MAIEERKVRRTVETKADPEIPETGANTGPFGGGNMLGEIAGIIEAKLNQPEAVLLREGGQALESAPSFSKAKTALDSRNPVQVLSSFFLAAGKRTLFKISL